MPHLGDPAEPSVTLARADRLCLNGGMWPLPRLLAELVRLPSVNPMGRTDLPPDWLYEARVVAYLEERLRELGCEYSRQPVRPGRDNLIARYTPPTPPPFTVLWEAHTDTVPVDGMSDPFSGRIHQGRLYGRGACDVKAGVAVMLAAFARLVRERPPGSAAVVLAFTVDEESGGLGVTELMNSGVRADYAIVAEPTRLNVVNAHKGVARFCLETTGRACHSSRPADGVNAIYRMARLLVLAETFAAELAARPGHPILGARTLSVGRVAGGTSANTVPDRCRAEIDRRLLPGETVEGAAAELADYLRSRADVDFDFTLTSAGPGCPALDPASSADLVQRLGAVVDAVVGHHAVHPVPFGTDASRIAAAGIPAVVFGPGDIAQAHTDDEWIDLNQLEPAGEILFRFASGK